MHHHSLIIIKKHIQVHTPKYIYKHRANMPYVHGIGCLCVTMPSVLSLLNKQINKTDLYMYSILCRSPSCCQTSSDTSRHGLQDLGMCLVVSGTKTLAADLLNLHGSDLLVQHIP